MSDTIIRNGSRMPQQNIFDDEPDGKASDPKKKWQRWRQSVIWLVSIILCLTFVLILFNTCKDMFLSPADASDATPITLVVPRGSGASAIAKLLYESGEEDGAGLIKHKIGKAVFKIYVDFTGKSNKLKAGTYILSRNMDIPQIVNIICEGNPSKATVRFTIAEGMGVKDIAKRLVELSILKDDTEFLNLCKTGEEFADAYSFIDDIPSNIEQNRDYALEGYLFPDTYEVYTDVTARTIITKMLDRFKDVFSTEYISRAKNMGMTTDEVIIMASMVEKEAKTADFSKVAAVFQNRLKANMRLESDAPLNYILGTTGKLQFTSAELANPSLYNTYAHQGLPLGAICNPGDKAIKAVLYPDEEYMKSGDEYYYFCLTTHETGLLVFAKTLREHNANTALYSPNW